MDAAPLPVAPSEVLSQDEVENLLAQVAAQENRTLVHTFAHRKEHRPSDSILPYDFRNPASLSQADLRRLKLHHEEFLRCLAARLSLYLRIEFSLKLNQLHTLPYHNLTANFVNPSHITLFKIEPLPGVCLLELHQHLALTIVDRLLGGPALALKPDHDLSEIELALLDQTAHLILSEWTNHWTSIQELHPLTLGHETNGRFLQTAPHDTLMLAFTFEARIGDCTELIQLAFPYNTLLPVIRKITLPLDGSPSLPSPNTGPFPKWNHHLDNVPIPVTATWNDIELSARQIANLKVGDVIQLDPHHPESVQVLLAGSPRFNARLGSRSNHLAVQLTQPIQP